MSGGPARGSVVMRVDGRDVVATPGISVAAALLAAGIVVLRRSPAGDTPRGAFCLMGVCQECTVLIEGRAERACMIAVRDGIAVSLRGPHAE